MKIKLAWLFADINFFQNKIAVANTQTNNPLALFYFGIGLVEFDDINKGFKLIEEGIRRLRDTENWYGLLEISTVYSIVLNNSYRKKELKSFWDYIRGIFDRIFGNDPKYKYLLVIPELFNLSYDNKDLKEHHPNIIDIVEQSGDRLIIALTHSFMADKDEEEKFIKSMKLSIKILESINARFRLILAYVNLATYYALKSRFEDFNLFIKKAIQGADDISKSKSAVVHIHPFSQKAWVMIKRGRLVEAKNMLTTVIKLAEDFSRPNYLIKSYNMLAYVNYLLNDNDSAFKHASIALEIASTNEESDLYKSILLEHIDLLIELKKMENVESYLSEAKVFIEDLDSCYKMFYDYIRAKYELSKYNIGFAKEILSKSSQQKDICSGLKPLIFLKLGESYLNEFRLSNNSALLEKAQQMIKRGIEDIVGVPERIKGKYLSAILLVAQKRDTEAEILLNQLVSDTGQTVPRFNLLAKQLLEDIRSVKNSEFRLSSVSNIKDVISYLQDAKSLTHTEPK
ncbi:MAG: hypothetical protein ACTSW1_01555 [Candidatus Hodarchaeales archaeon]